jgi:hypothetical protein
MMYLVVLLFYGKQKVSVREPAYGLEIFTITGKRN